ncbi:MAG: efflux RND transporter permease subunit [Planctomycetes bacterium]|nr:efflux RND transporter permease subunit [Planctomycetota bacterium]
MWLVRLGLRNPYAVLVMALGTLVLGVFVLFGPKRIPADILPQFKTPAVQVLTLYPGMPAETVERDMNTRLQRWTGQSVGIEHQEAKAMLGVSVVRDFFHEHIDPDAAMAQVTSYAMSDLYYLPPGTIPPMVMPFDPTASIPLCLFGIASKVDSEGKPLLDETRLYDVAYFEGRNKLQSIAGVVAPAVYGGRLRRIYAYVDRNKLEGRDLSPMDVVHAIHRNNVFIPTGSARFGPIEYQVVSNAMVPEVEEINEFPIKLDGHAPVLIKDIGEAEDTSELQSNIVRNGMTGKRMLYIPIYRQPGANTIAVVDGVRNQMKDIERRLNEPNMDLGVIFDQSVFVRDSIRELIQEGVLGAVLAAIMILIFLRSFRSTFFILITLPLSVLVCIIGLFFLNHTINAITLGGLAIAVGLLIDQSIVVLENVERHLGMGKSSMQAAMDGALEVARPVLVIVSTICVVFFPVLFFTGIGKFLFTPLAISVSLAIAGSYVMALTIVPVLGAKFLKARAGGEEHGAGWFEGLRRGYERLLEGALRVRWGVLAAVAVLFALTVAFIYPRLGTELFPQVNAGQFTIRVRATSGLKVDETEKILEKVEFAVKEVMGENLDRMITNIGVLMDWPAAYTPNSGPHDAFILVQHNRRRTDQEYARELRRVLPERFPGVEFSFEPNSMLRAALNFGLPAPINIQVEGRDLHTCMRIAERVKRAVREVPGTVDVRIQQRLDYPQFKLVIDRRKCAELGLAQEDVVKNVVTAFNSSVSFAKSFWVDERSGNHYWIGAQYPERAMEDLETLLNVPITSARQNEPILLRDVAKFERSTAPSEVMHYNIARVIDVYAEVDRRDLGSVSAEVDGKIRDIERDPEVAKLITAGYKIHRRGEVRSMEESFRTLGLGLGLSAVLVYLVMVILFRSLLQPLIVMIAAPLGLIGVIWMLYVTGTFVSIQSLMGVIMMVGIVVSFSILMIDFANRRLAEGKSRWDAIREAAAIRLRPILMVSLAAMLGLVPMAVAGGANIPLARAVVGGVLSATVLTLFVVPALYVILGGGSAKESAA